MFKYCLKSKRNTKNVNSKVLETTNGRAMLLSNVLYAVVKNQISERTRIKRIIK